MFDALSSLDLTDKCEKRENLTYLSWANAWSEFKHAYPSATYSIIKNPATGLPYFADPDTGIIVFTEVSVDGITHEMWLPVMDNKNKAMKLTPYNYQGWDSKTRSYTDRTVAAATMFDINKTIMRCLVKNLAMFGLALYIYAGDDLPERDRGTDDGSSVPPAAPKPMDRFAPIKNAISQTLDSASLLELYFQHQTEVDANPEVKMLFTRRKNQLRTNS